MTDGPPQFAIDVDVSSKLHTITLAGEMDMAGAPELAAVISGICANEQRTVVIDLRNLTFIDSSGLQALVRAHQDCLARGYELRVIPGPENVHRLFEITGMNETLPFTDPDA
jgi:anti-sigma B factor antagonist